MSPRVKLIACLVVILGSAVAVAMSLRRGPPPGGDRMAELYDPTTNRREQVLWREVLQHGVPDPVAGRWRHKFADGTWGYVINPGEEYTPPKGP